MVLKPARQFEKAHRHLEMQANHALAYPAYSGATCGQPLYTGNDMVVDPCIIHGLHAQAMQRYVHQLAGKVRSLFRLKMDMRLREKARGAWKLA